LAVLVFTRLGDITWAASFTTGMRIMQMIVDFSQAPFYSKLPRITILFSEQNYGVMHGIARQGMQRAHWAFVMSAAIAGVAASAGLYFIGSSVQNFPEGLFWALLMLGMFMQRMGAMHLQFFSISNKIVWHKAGGISGLLFITSAWVLLPYSGLLAYPLALLICNAGFYTWYCARHSYRFFGLSFWSYESAVALPPLLLVIIYLVLAWAGLPVSLPPAFFADWWDKLQP
jgi:hypothetical protein